MSLGYLDSDSLQNTRLCQYLLPTSREILWLSKCGQQDDHTNTDCSRFSNHIALIAAQTLIEWGEYLNISNLEISG